MIKALELKVDENGKMVGLDEVTLDKVLEAIKDYTKETEENCCENTDDNISSKEVVIEPGKAYLLVNRIKKLLDNSEEIYKLIESIATDNDVLEAGYSTDCNSILIIFKTKINAIKFAARLSAKIKSEITKIQSVNTLIEASEIGLFIFADINNEKLYKHIGYKISNKPDNGLVCDSITETSDTPLLDIERLCRRFGFECKIKDTCKNIHSNDVENELDNEQFPHLVESYKPDYLDKQEKLTIIQEMNVIHTSFYGVFKDTLLRMSGLALHSLKNELNNNNLKGALEILLKHIKG